jgi:hypothetical protein
MNLLVLMKASLSIFPGASTVPQRLCATGEGPRACYCPKWAIGVRSKAAIRGIFSLHCRGQLFQSKQESMSSWISSTLFFVRDVDAAIGFSALASSIWRSGPMSLRRSLPISKPGRWRSRMAGGARRS